MNEVMQACKLALDSIKALQNSKVTTRITERIGRPSIQPYVFCTRDCTCAVSGLRSVPPSMLSVRGGQGRHAVRDMKRKYRRYSTLSFDRA